MASLRVTVHATCANLGPGFDCLGLAVGMRNECLFSWGAGAQPGLAIEIEGEGADVLPRDASHATVQSLRRGLEDLGASFPERLALRQHNRIPVARGLGSSAAARVAGLAAARALAGLDPDPAWLLGHAAALEGHPDNVAAAIYGGVTAACETEDGTPACLSLPYPADLQVALAVPDFHVSTEEARGVLPAVYPREDVVFTLSRAALLVGALARNDAAALAEAVRDRVHTPYRAALIPGFAEVRAAALRAGAAGVFISGSGPTVGAFSPAHAHGLSIAMAMIEAFQKHGVRAQGHASPIAAGGVTVEPLAR